MVASFQNLEQKLTKFLKFPEIPAQNSPILGNSRGNFWDVAFPGIPGGPGEDIT